MRHVVSMQESLDIMLISRRIRSVLIALSVRTHRYVFFLQENNGQAGINSGLKIKGTLIPIKYPHNDEHFLIRVNKDITSSTYRLHVMQI